MLNDPSAAPILTGQSVKAEYSQQTLGGYALSPGGVACGGGGGDAGPPKFGGPGMKLLGRESSIVPGPTFCFPAGVVCGSDAPVHPFGECSVAVASPVQAEVW